MDLKNTKKALFGTVRNFKQILPIILGVIMLVSLFLVLIPNSFYTTIFTGNKIVDPLMGATVGSISSGNPLISYILGGELLDQGVSLIAVTAFILSWVTVGIIQLPAESLMLGRRFALTRNVISFISSIIVAFLTVFTLSLI
ncbi:hypothetical protein JW758_00735 [Candidatus Peregrinibacteria bacterium]|nr:hypothetical protein [Candidatus Peregrinibacteria bacterium]